MRCSYVKVPGGGVAMVCSQRGPRRRCQCGRGADLLCDWKVPGKRSGTCDKPICSRCTTSPAPDKDLCPKHATEWAARKARLL